MEWTENLVTRLCAGDEQAYEELVSIEWSHSVRTAWFILHNIHDAEEAAQEAFINVYRSRQQLRDPNKMRAWFYSILVNAARQQMRRRRPQVQLDDTAAQNAQLASDPISQADTRLTLRNALLQLSEDERTAVVLSYYTGLKDTEAATAAGWNLGKYKYRLAAGKRHLAKLLNHEAPVAFQREGVHNA